MTVQNLKGNFSKFGAYYCYKFRSLRTLVILNCIFALLSYPFAMTAAILSARNSVAQDELRELPDYFKLPEYIALTEQGQILENLLITAVVICMIMLAAMFIMNFAFVNKSFRWLYNKSVVDMDYSLPVSDDTRFFGDLLASLTGSLVPHLAAIAIAGGLYWMLPFGGMAASGGEAWGVFSIALQLVFTGIVACVMFMGSCLLVMSFCGRAVESRIMPFVVNLVVPAINAICILSLVQGIYGFGGNSTYEYNSVGVTSPLGLLFMTVFTLTNYVDDMEKYRAFMLHSDIMIPLIIVILGCFALAYLLVRFRRSERVGVSYVYPAVKVVMHFAVIFVIVSLFMLIAMVNASEQYSMLNSELIGPFVGMVIMTFVIYVIMELVSGRGFRKFHITLLRYAVTMIVSVCICLGLYFSQGTGFADYVPENNEIARVYISVSNNADYIDGEKLENMPELSRTFLDTNEEIDRVLSVHESMPKRQAQATGKRVFTFNVGYYLKGGSIVHRRYMLTWDEYAAAMEKLLTPEIYYHSECSRWRWDLVDEEYNVYSDRYIQSIHTENYMRVLNIPVEDYFEALRKDSELVSFDLLSDPDNRMIEGTFRISRMYLEGSEEEYRGWYTTFFEIWSWQKNVISLLEGNGVDILFPDNGSEEKAMMIRLPADDAFLKGEVEKMYLGNLYKENQTSGSVVYCGDYGYSKFGSDEMLPGGNFEMIDPGEETISALHMAEDTVFEYEETFAGDYDHPYIYVLIYVDMESADEDGTLTVDLTESAMFVRDYSYWSAEYLFENTEMVYYFE